MWPCRLILFVFSAVDQRITIMANVTASTLPQSVLSLSVYRSSVKQFDSRNNLHRRQLLSNRTGTTPLYEGLGTHYSYIYVGTPPQRVSVIVDTGSHHTAFPCVGCSCGKHMNPLWDPAKSNTSKIVKCPGTQRCYFSQSYSEGSSWRAYRVKDTLWAGGAAAGTIRTAADWSVDFQFGCQDSERGLFRTQHVDGIMGMSASEDTLPHQLVAQKVTDTHVFALCLNVGGGVMTLGGVDSRLHHPDAPVAFAKLLKSKGWYTVRLLDVFLRPSDSSSGNKQVSLGASVELLNGQNSKGAIVDSGTTDTYLPRAVAQSFEDAFKKLSNGMTYSNNNRRLTKSQVERLPVVVYKLQGADGAAIEVECPPLSYAEHMGGDRYAFRIYLTESSGSGTVLGFNFMSDHNVIFDTDHMRVGFAKANCKSNQPEVLKKISPSEVNGKKKRSWMPH